MRYNSAANNNIADVPSITSSRYLSGAYPPHSGYVADYNSAQLHVGKALTTYYNGFLSSGAVTSSSCTPVHAQVVQIFYNGSLASSASSITMHWGYNGWNGVTDTVMTRTSNGAWTGFAMVPSSATQLNMAFYNQSNTWDNNNGQNYSLTVS